MPYSNIRFFSCRAEQNSMIFLAFCTVKALPFFAEYRSESIRNQKGERVFQRRRKKFIDFMFPKLPNRKKKEKILRLTPKQVVPLTGLEPVRSFKLGILRQITLLFCIFYSLTTKCKNERFCNKNRLKTAKISIKSANRILRTTSQYNVKNKQVPKSSQKSLAAFVSQNLKKSNFAKQATLRYRW